MKMTPFQIVIIAIFVVFMVLGVVFFAMFGGLTDSGDIGEVTIWGTIDEAIVADVLRGLEQEDRAYEGVRYEEKDPRRYRTDLINALAAGTAPDLILLAQGDILDFSDKVMPIPYSALSERKFKDAFIAEGNLYLSPEGIRGLPLTVDPLVMYVNQDVFAAAGVAQVPRYWDEFFTIAPKITSLDASSNVRRSAVALGSYDNVRHAKEILSALFLQAEDPIVSLNKEGIPEVVLGADHGVIAEPAESALRFYTEFSNPSKSVYSWNRALPNSQDAFVAGNVAVYFGFASEYPLLRERNPNLAIEVATLPQVRDSKSAYTFGRMQALSLTRTTDNPQGAFIVAQTFTRADIAQKFADALMLPPVRRDTIADVPENAAGSVFAESALMARGWLEPDPSATATIFKTMIDSVVSGRSQLNSAIREAASSLEELLIES